MIQVNYEMLRQVRFEQQPVTQAAKAFGFSRPSFCQAQLAFEQNGLPGLIPQKRGPRSGHKLTGEMMEFLNHARAKDSFLRTDDLVQVVKEEFGMVVHPRGIQRQLFRQKKLCRYAARPAVATERLSALTGERLLYRLKRPWRHGTSAIIFEPQDLIAKLAALVPALDCDAVRFRYICRCWLIRLIRRLITWVRDDY